MFSVLSFVFVVAGQEFILGQPVDQIDAIQLLQLKAVALNARVQSNESNVNVLTANETAGGAAVRPHVHSSGAKEGAKEGADSSAADTVQTAPAALTSDTKEATEHDGHGHAPPATQVPWSWKSIAYHLKQFCFTPAFWPALTKTFCIVGVAELFDKTWFVALICAVSFGIRNAFFGAFTGLLLHVLIAAALGLGISQFLPISVLHFITAAVFAVFAGLFSWEWHAADPETDALQSRKEEAKEDLGETSAKGASKHSGFFNLLMWQCFMSVFIAEWGDRTQIAMIALHSSLPVVPVCIGSALAFFVLTLSAVLVAALLEGRNLSERTVCGVSAVSFFVFAFLAVMDGMRARQTEMLS